MEQGSNRSLKIPGAILVVFGIAAVLMGSSCVQHGETISCPPIWVPVLGAIMIVAGGCLYYFGRKSKKAV